MENTISYKIEIYWKRSIGEKTFRTYLLKNIVYKNVPLYFIAIPNENHGLGHVKIAIFATRLHARLAIQSVSKFTWCEVNEYRYNLIKISIIKI